MLTRSLVHTKDEEKGKELHVVLAYAYARAIETKDPSVIEDRWPGHRYLRTGEVASLRGKRGKVGRQGEEKEEGVRKGRTDENATGKSYRDTANPRHGTWATVLHLRACVRVRACMRVSLGERA